MSDFAFIPTDEQIKHSNIFSFMQKYNITSLEELSKKATNDLEWFWKSVDEDIGIKELKIEVNSVAQNVEITVNKYDSKPTAVTKEATGSVNKYLQIETENLEDKLENAKIKIQNKKALSEIVSIVLFILMAITALGIVWSATKPLLISPTYVFSCTEAKINQPLTINKVCYNSEKNDVELTLTRKISDTTQITSLDFTITFSEGDNINYYCGKDCEDATILKPGEIKTYFFRIEDSTNLNNAIVGINECALISSEQITGC